LKKLPLLELTNKMTSGAARDRDPGESSLALAMYHPLASLLAGLRFLTILPVSWKSHKDGRFFKASLIWFPCIGLFIGALSGLSISFFIEILPGSLSAVFGLVLLAGISGCLHLDGLADSGDGLLSSRPRDRALDIMRDSNIGAMGVIALFFVLLGKYAALSTLSSTMMLQALLLMPMAGRTAIVMSMAILPYARTGDGLGALFYSTESRRIAILGLFFCLLIALLFSFSSALLILFATLLTVALFSLWCYRKLGGATGDTLGAVCELTELAVAVSLCVTSRIN
jgi:adenosylcobinamide-GDP ribazoletransferase